MMMPASVTPPTKIQKQLKRLLSVLVFLTAVNAAFFAKNISRLFDAYFEVSQTQRLVSSAGDMMRLLSEENRLRNSDPGTADNRLLSSVRKQIKSTFKDMRLYSTDKSQVNQIQTEWQRSHNSAGNSQVVLLLRQLVSTQQKMLLPLEANVTKANTSAYGFLLTSFGIFVFAIFVLSQFIKARIFAPLGRLSEKIKNFEAGNHQLPPPGSTDSEIGALEAQFYSMAGRVGDTVTQLKELDKVKTDFISIVSHELRTPMTSVKGSLSLILSGSVCEVDPEIKQLLSIAETETDRLIRLINDILDLTKIEAKKMPLDRKPHVIGEIIETAVQGIRGLSEVTKVQVAVSPWKAPLRISVDKDRIQQVITNLLSNAIKYSPSQATVTISYTPQGPGVLISIKDQGPGIKPEQQSHLFEKFRSVDSGKSKIIKGTGLGLPICKAIVEQHGGHIGARSEPGKGSEFYFYIPDATTDSSMEAAA